MYKHDNRIVITLDAGGTNFVFGAMQANNFIVEPYTLPSNSGDLDKCLATMVEGFKYIIDKLPAPAAAISFAFPGPADYPNGIIGGYLPNFPSFRDGVALGPFLEEQFGLPVFINNDGDLYAYGEALAGILPEINAKLERLHSSKRYRNLIGYTFGTGFGVGTVINGELNRGDNSCVETFCLEHKNMKGIIVEAGVSVNAIKRVYADKSGDVDHKLEPHEIFEIAECKRAGNADAAKAAFSELGEVAGAAMCSSATLIDSIIVIGGGITAARKYIMPALFKSMRSKIQTITGELVNRVQMEVFDLENEEEFSKFAAGSKRELKVYGSEKSVVYDPMKRIGVAISHLGANQAISLGAYSFALSQIDKNDQ